MKAVQFGAGNIGRGFIGQLLSLSGYEVVFVDLDAALVGALDERRRYPVRVVSDAGDSESFVENVRALDGRDAEAVSREIAGADLVCTAVGAPALRGVAPVYAAGLARRWRRGEERPLDVILCENLADAGAVFRGMVAAALAGRSEGIAAERLEGLAGFVRASVGRMVPVMTEAMRGDDPLRIWVEAYDRLPVDAEAFAGPLPPLRNLEPVSPFELCIQRKLYVHNLGHAVAAYLGALRGYRFIWQSMADEIVASATREAMCQAALAIAAEHRVDSGPLLAHAEDLLRRFANRRLGDTVERVGRDLPRKLAPRDRLLGAVGLCARHGLPRDRILDGLAAALLFDDSSSSAARGMIAAGGPGLVLRELCGIKADDPDSAYVLARYESMRGRPSAGL